MPLAVGFPFVSQVPGVSSSVTFATVFIAALAALVFFEGCKAGVKLAVKLHAASRMMLDASAKK